MTFRLASDRSLLVTFGDEISPESHHSVTALTAALSGKRGILNLHPAYTSVLIDFDPHLLTHEDVEQVVGSAISSPVPLKSDRTIEIPVRYGGEFGPDLEDVARHTGLSVDRVIEMHSAADYFVYFVGFSTCFPYLGGLLPELATPRLQSPRKHVPEGSIAIGGSQAGVYPLSSPGGWRLIGRTSLRLFDPAAEPPGLLRMGDHIRFVPENGS